MSIGDLFSFANLSKLAGQLKGLGVQLQRARGWELDFPLCLQGEEPARCESTKGQFRLCCRESIPSFLFKLIVASVSLLPCLLCPSKDIAPSCLFPSDSSQVFPGSLGHGYFQIMFLPCNPPACFIHGMLCPGNKNPCRRKRWNSCKTFLTSSMRNLLSGRILFLPSFWLAFIVAFPKWETLKVQFHTIRLRHNSLKFSRIYTKGRKCFLPYNSQISGFRKYKLCIQVGCQKIQALLLQVGVLYLGYTVYPLKN